jgi:hypothetical protein
MSSQDVDEELKNVRRLGVSGVPFFVFKSGGVSGAQVPPRQRASLQCSCALAACVCAAAVHHRGRGVGTKEHACF